MFLGGGGHCATKWSQVVKVACGRLESSGSAPKRVPGPSRTGRAPSESRRSNSPTDFLPRCRETLAFAGLRAGRPRHCGAGLGPRLHARRVIRRAHAVPHRARRRRAARHGAVARCSACREAGRAAAGSPGSSRAALCVGRLPLLATVRTGRDRTVARIARGSRADVVRSRRACTAIPRCASAVHGRRCRLRCQQPTPQQPQQ